MALKKFTVTVVEKDSGGVLFEQILESRSQKILKAIHTAKWMHNPKPVRVIVKRKFQAPKYQINIFDVIEEKIPAK
jgi:hypothetical protein